MTTLSGTDIQSILACLPHRYPFLLIDKVISIIPGQSILAIKNVTINEPFFQGHFPNQPIMPGVLIVEAMAQATGILGLYSCRSQNLSKQALYLLAAIDKVKFKAPVIPGDQLQIEATVQWERSPFLKCITTARLGEQLVCSAEITGAKQAHSES